MSAEALKLGLTEIDFMAGFVLKHSGALITLYREEHVVRVYVMGVSKPSIGVWIPSNGFGDDLKFLTTAQRDYLAKVALRLYTSLGEPS